MISTLRNISDFKTKAIELGFDLPPRPSKHELQTGGSIKRYSNNYVFSNPENRYKEYRLFKWGDDGSKWVMIGVFDMKENRILSYELSNLNSTEYSGFNLKNQEEWLETPGIARAVFGEIEFTTSEIISNDGISNKKCTCVSLNNTQWYDTASISIIIPRR